MKTKLLIIHNGRPYLADGEKPPFYTKEKYSVITKRDIALNETILKDWENSLEEPETVKYDPFNKQWQWTDKPEWSETTFYHSFNQSGQLVEVEGKTIIRLL